MINAIVWSKDGCGHCVQAKALLESNGIAYEERNITGGTWTREQLFEAVPTAKTMPQIFLDGEYVGSYTELRDKLK
jgi:glutaredoxin 3